MIIEKNIPIPPKKHLNYAYPFESMKIGDSFFVKCAEENKKKLEARLRSAVYSYSDRTKTIFSSSVRHVKGGVRLWRVN